MLAQEQGAEGGKEKSCGVEMERGEQLGNEFQRFGQSSTAEAGRQGLSLRHRLLPPAHPPVCGGTRKRTGPGSGNTDQESGFHGA